MSTVTKFCRCSNHEKFNGSGCAICSPIDIECYSDDEYFYIINVDGFEKAYSNDEAQYLLEQLILRFQPWGNAG